MPNQLAKKTSKPQKTKSPRNSDDDFEDMPAIDVKYNPDIIDSHLQDIEEIVNTKCNQIQKDIDFMKTSVRQAFHLELIKIPTHVKQMSVVRFRQEFGESLEAVTRDALGGLGSNKANQVQMTANKHAKLPQSKVFQTPAASKYGDLNLRLPREGEKILSVNGSPLGVFNTAVKTKKDVGLIPQTPGVFVPLKSGDVIDIESVSSLPEDQKREALEKVQTMMSTMQTLMSKLQKK